MADETKEPLRAAARNAAELLEEEARTAEGRVVGAESDPDCDEQTIAVLKRYAARWREPADRLRAALSAVSAPAPDPLRAEIERIATEIEGALAAPRGLERGALRAAKTALRAALRAAAPPPEPPGWEEIVRLVNDLDSAACDVGMTPEPSRAQNRRREDATVRLLSALRAAVQGDEP